MKERVKRKITKNRAHFTGLVRCGLLWECPVCSLKIRMQRAEEITAAVTVHGKARTYLSTLTIQHGLGNDLRYIRKGMAAALRRTQQGKTWTKIKTDFGIIGKITALEVTHGKCGFHPHYHILLFLERPLTAEELERFRCLLRDRWIKMVRRYLGAEHAPNARRAVQIDQGRSETYIAKMGLELTAPVGKTSRRKGRTPFEVANALVTDGLESDEIIWNQFRRGIRGARMLYWSPGLRERLGLGAEKTDQEVVEENAEEGSSGDEFGDFEADEWKLIQDRPQEQCAILDAMEIANVAADRPAAIRECLSFIDGILTRLARARASP